MNWLPNFFVAGAPKAGTSSMHQWIADHPDAFGSREKETYFFVDPGTHMYRPEAHIALGLEHWKDQFDIPEGVAPKVIVESTPASIYYEAALKGMPALPTQPKCLFILREPSAAIYSLYTYFRNNWNWIPADMSFEEFLEAARAGTHDFKGNELAKNVFAYGRYVDFLKRWRAALGEDRIMVVGFEELKNDHVGLTKRVAEWLGLDPSFYDSYEFPRENETYVPKNRALQQVNIAIRGMLPKGKLYDALRALYRKLNTEKGQGARPASDDELLAALRQEFEPANAELEREFGVRL